MVSYHMDVFELKGYIFGVVSLYRSAYLIDIEKAHDVLLFFYT